MDTEAHRLEIEFIGKRRFFKLVDTTSNKYLSEKLSYDLLCLYAKRVKPLKETHPHYTSAIENSIEKLNLDSNTIYRIKEFPLPPEDKTPTNTEIVEITEFGSFIREVLYEHNLKVGKSRTGQNKDISDKINKINNQDNQEKSTSQIHTPLTYGIPTSPIITPIYPTQQKTKKPRKSKSSKITIEHKSHFEK
jgi:hypothetical protein